MRNLFVALLLCLLCAKADAQAPGPNLLKDMGPNKTQKLLHRDGGVTYYTIASNTGEAVWANHGSYAVELANFPGKSFDIFPTIPGSTDFFFLVKNINTSESIWRTDGTVAGTYQIETLNVNLYPSHNFIHNNKVYCVTYDPNTTTNPFGLFVTDGSLNGGNTVGNLAAFPQHFHSIPGSNLVNFMISTFSNVEEVWQTDGTNAGTQLHPHLPTATSFSDFGGFFQGRAMYVLGREVWASDGTAAGTDMLMQFPADVYPIFADIDQDLNTYYFFTQSAVLLESGFWKTDGTAANTVLIADIPNSSGFDNIQRVNNEFFFSSILTSVDFTVYHSDGTTSGTKLIGTIYSARPYGVTAIGNPVKYYFAAGRLGQGGTLFDFWSINLQQDTIEVMSNYGLRDENPFKIQTSQGELHYYYSAEVTPPYDSQIWVTDGTTNGMQMLTQYPSNITLNFFSFPGHDGVFYFLKDPNDRAQLWEIGSSPGSEQLVTTLGDSTAKFSSPKVYFDEGKYYMATTYHYPGGLLSKIGITDGTAAGTQMFPNRFETTSYWHQHYLGPDSTFCFFANSLNNRLQLWTFAEVATAVESADALEEALLYPNPGNTARLRIPSAWLQSGEGRFTLSDMQGRQVAQGPITQTEQTLPATKLPAGIYLVNVQAGGHHWTGKWIKSYE